MKVLLIDAAFSAKPIYDYLIDVGCEVWTIGNRPHDQLALVNATRWIEGDYSDVSFVMQCVKNYGFDRVVPGCTDVSMSTFAQLSIDSCYHYSFEVDRLLNYKVLFRKLCFELGLPSPRFIERKEFPVVGRYICKPADSYSGRGVSIFDGLDRLACERSFELARRHSPTSQIICEEFIDGQLYSYTAFLEANKVVKAFTVIEGSRYDQFAVDTSYLCVDIADHHLTELQTAVESLSRHLSLSDGLVHTQFVKSGERLAILEMTRRCPGDLYSLLIEKSTGYSYAGKYASYFIGKNLTTNQQIRRFVLRHTLKQLGSKNFGLIEHLPKHNFLELIPVVRLGEPIDPLSYSRVALSFSEVATETELKALYAELIGNCDAVDFAGHV